MTPTNTKLRGAVSTAPEASALLEAAFLYHSYGWPVIPVREDKRPLCKWGEWLTRGQSEADVRDQPWDGAHGVALVTWPGSDLVVLDWDGIHAKDAWKATGVGLPETARTRTRSGGRHWIFRVPSGMSRPEEASPRDHRRRVRLLVAECGCERRCGVDLLLSGYFIVPPTPGYREDPDHPLDPSVLATIPQAVLDLVHARENKPLASAPSASDGNWITAALRGPIPEGERNATAVRLAGYLLPRHKNSVETVLGILEPWAGKVCVPAMEPRELRAVVESIAKREASKARAQSVEKDLPQGSQLLALAREATLFHDEQNEAYVVIPVAGHEETQRVRSRGFKGWLARRYFEKTGKASNAEALTSALNILEAKASYEGQRHDPGFRVAERNGTFYYDLADSEWRAVAVDASGWRVGSSAYLFQRGANTGPQVLPVGGGQLRPVLDFVPLRSEDAKLLFMVYLVTCLVPTIPHPVVVVTGEQGAAKSSFTRVIRRLVDPAHEELLAVPRDPSEPALLLARNYVPAFDNLDGLASWQSDMLARAVTGGGISKRRLYSDDEEVILKFRRCVVMNGINPGATRPDLLDRTLPFALERIPPEQRREEAELWRAFEAARPLVLGATLDALARAMAIHPTVQLPRLPRMADFCRWGFAVAAALGIGGEAFLAAYGRAIGQTNEAAIQAHPVASAVMAFMVDKAEWEGTPAELLGSLEVVAGTERIDTRAMTWPKAAHVLTKRLREAKSILLEAGIEVQLDGRTGAHRRIGLRKNPERSVPGVTSVIDSLNRGVPDDAPGDAPGAKWEADRDSVTPVEPNGQEGMPQYTLLS